MIPAGDFVLNASLVPGRLTYHLDRGGWSHWLEYEATVFRGAEPHLISYIKGIAERHLGHLFLEVAGESNLYAVLTILLTT